MVPDTDLAIRLDFPERAVSFTTANGEVWDLVVDAADVDGDTLLITVMKERGNNVLVHLPRLAEGEACAWVPRASIVVASDAVRLTPTVESVVSIREQRIARRHRDLIVMAQERGECIDHCHGSNCFRDEPRDVDVCVCTCEGCNANNALRLRATAAR